MVSLPEWFSTKSIHAKIFILFSWYVTTCKGVCYEEVGTFLIISRYIINLFPKFKLLSWKLSQKLFSYPMQIHPTLSAEIYFLHNRTEENCFYYVARIFLIKYLCISPEMYRFSFSPQKDKHFIVSSCLRLRILGRVWARRHEMGEIRHNNMRMLKFCWNT